MNILSYRKKHGLSQASFAALLRDAGHPTSQGLVSHWEQGVVRISPDRATQIEGVTKGEIRRADLVFGEVQQLKKTG